MSNSTSRSVSEAAIVVYGRDPDLLYSRQLVLENSGHQVLPALSFSELEKAVGAYPYDLLILCHSLKLEDLEAALQMVHAHWPGTKNLVLTAGTPVPTLGPEDELLNIFQGPKNLVESVSRLLATPKTRGDSSPVSPHSAPGESSP